MELAALLSLTGLAWLPEEERRELCAWGVCVFSNTCAICKAAEEEEAWLEVWPHGIFQLDHNCAVWIFLLKLLLWSVHCV